MTLPRPRPAPRAEAMPEAAVAPTQLILVNPKSFRMSLRGRLPRLADLAERRAVALHQVETPADIERLLAPALGRNLGLLVVIGGDGTVQAAVTLLARLCAPEQMPRLLVLGGGRTNYTARDIGTQGQLLNRLELALEQPALLQTTTRHSLIVRHPDVDDQHGFFLAGALVDHIIRDCHAYRAQGGGPLRRGHLSSAWRVSQIGVLAALGRWRYDAPHLQIEAGELGRLDAPIRLLVITSLHHREEWLDPYAARGEGEIRVSAVSRQADGFWRRLPRLLQGRYQLDMRPESGYLSGCVPELRISGICQVTLDGQEIDLDPTRPLTIATGPAFRFLHP